MQINSCTIIGAGGTGQGLIPSLIRLLKYHPHGTEDIVIYDGDDFEAHNAERQIGSTGSKANVMGDMLKQQGLSALLKPAYMTRQRLEIIRDRDAAVGGMRLVIAAVDNDATRKMCIDVLLDKPGDFLFVTPGNSDASDPEASIKGNVLWFGRIGDQQIGVNPSLLFPNIEEPQDVIPKRGGCLEHAPSAPQLISANALAAALTLCTIQNFLDDQMPLQASHAFFNGRTYSLSAN